MSLFPSQALEKLADLLRNNTQARGLDKLPPSTDLADAANALWQAKRVLFLTGFLIASAKTGETDGPPGTLGLASACDQLGKEVCLVTDKYTEAALKEIVALFHWKQTPQVVVIEKGNEELLSYTLLTRFAPDHVVAIERPGQNIKGRYHSMSGVDFTDLVPDTDLLLYLAREQGAGISAIGDGGNEVGMGKIADFTKEHVPHGENICAAFAADHLIVAGISNWGAAALAALLSIAAQRPLLHTADLEEEMVHRLADAGLIDGATRSFTHTVDGWEMPLYTGVHQAIYAVMLDNINH